MKTSINLKTSKMKNKYLKLGMMAAVMLSASIGFAQTAPADAGTNAGIQKDAGAGESIKVIDNKGTIKYLQTNNGITSITSTAGGNKTTTTWQLGGTLVDATTITTSATGTFTIDGEEFNLANTEVNASAAATTTDDTGTGYTLLVREENSGQVKKMLATDLITGIRKEYEQETNDATENVAITVSGLPIIDVTNDFKLSVYRNGVKLRFGTDFTAKAVNTLNITWNATDLPMYIGDIIEIQYLK
jgi:hypothetical protein